MNTSSKVAFTLFVLIATWVTTALADRVDPAVAVRGYDPACGVLTNYSAGADPDSDIQTGLVTVVTTHGWNPAPKKYRHTTPEVYARAVRDRGSGAVNALGWNWNGCSFDHLCPDCNVREAIRQGRLLANELIRRGVEPERTQLIGHSLGSIVMASAAQHLWTQTGKPIARLTMLDSPKRKLSTTIYQLQAKEAAVVVENFWATGPTAVGAPVNDPGVVNVRVPSRRPNRRTRNPARINHVDIILWYLDTYLR